MEAVYRRYHALHFIFSRWIRCSSTTMQLLRRWYRCYRRQTHNDTRCCCSLSFDNSSSSFLVRSAAFAITRDHSQITNDKINSRIGKYNETFLIFEHESLEVSITVDLDHICFCVYSHELSIHEFRCILPKYWPCWTQNVPVRQLCIELQHRCTICTRTTAKYKFYCFSADCAVDTRAQLYRHRTD